MATTPNKDARAFLEALQRASGDYFHWALNARQLYAGLRLRQDVELRKLYQQVARKIGKQLKGLTGAEAAQLENLRKSLQAAARDLNAAITGHLESYTAAAAAAGSVHAAGALTTLVEQAGPAVAARITSAGIEAMRARVNRAAVEAVWARSTNGLYLSERIWRTSQRSVQGITDLIRESVAAGNDAVVTARMLETYVMDGAKTVAGRYPNMQERLSSTWPKGLTFQEAKARGLLRPSGQRVPNDVCYEALRLARTETSGAYNEATVSQARMSLSYEGMQWLLSGSHPKQDICDSYAHADHGLGEGVYPPGAEPYCPAHANCICNLCAKHTDPLEYAERLRAWDGPESDPELELWYRRVYRGLPEEQAMQGLRLTDQQRARAVNVGWISPPSRAASSATGAAAKVYLTAQAYTRYEQKASRHYQAITRRTDDVAAIARHTDLPEADIQAIKDYLFVETHTFADGSVKQFDPDYDVVLAWRRLISGTDIRESDLVLLRHELVERDLMAAGETYEHAHTQANLRYNWVEASKDDPED